MLKCFYYSHGECVCNFSCWWTVIWLTFTVSVVLAELKSRSALTGDASFGCLSANVCTAMIFIHAGGHFFSSIKTHCRTKKEENMHPCWIKVWISFLKILLTPNFWTVEHMHLKKGTHSDWLKIFTQKKTKNLDILNFCHFWLETFKLLSEQQLWDSFSLPTIWPLSTHSTHTFMWTYSILKYTH